MQFTLKEVAEFCWDRKGSRAFKDYTYEEIASHIVEKAANKELVVVYDERGISGVCTYTRLSQGRRYLYINHIVCARGAFRHFLRAARERFPKWILAGQRGGKSVIYDLL